MLPDFRASTGGNEPPYKPARHLSEGRAGKIVWHIGSTRSVTSQHMAAVQTIEKAPRFQRLQVANAEDMNQLQMEGKAFRLASLGCVEAGQAVQTRLIGNKKVCYALNRPVL